MSGLTALAPHVGPIRGEADLEPGVAHRHVEVARRAHDGAGAPDRGTGPAGARSRGTVAAAMRLSRNVGVGVGSRGRQGRCSHTRSSSRARNKASTSLLEVDGRDLDHAAAEHRAGGRWPGHGRPHDVVWPGVGNRSEVGHRRGVARVGIVAGHGHILLDLGRGLGVRGSRGLAGDELTQVDADARWRSGPAAGAQDGP